METKEITNKGRRIVLYDNEGNVESDFVSDGYLLSANVMGDNANRCVFYTKCDGNAIINIFYRALQVIARFRAGGDMKLMLTKEVEANTGVSFKRVKKEFVNEKG